MTISKSKTEMPAIRDFGRVMDMLRWHDLDEILPAGSGWCLDVGCGNGRHRAIIEQRGYRWLGLDQAPAAAERGMVRANCCRLPIRSGGAASMILWQVLEYVEEPERVFAEAFRVLEPGGIFCGSVSFLEPVHGKTLYGLSFILLERLLRKHGFEEIRIRPGLCGFALLLWTWLRRSIGPWAVRLALPITALWLLPLTGARFLLSYAAWRVGLGGGHGVHWLTRRAPLEFAGHVLFSAQKPLRSE